MSCGRLTHAVIGLLWLLVTASCASDGDAEPRTAAPPATTTVSATVTVAETVTEAASSRGAGSSAKELRFRGDGDRRLPPIRVARGGGTLRWTNDGEVFSLFSDEGTLVDSVAQEGETFLEGGVHRIDVVASGSWVIRMSRARRG